LVTVKKEEEEEGKGRRMPMLLVLLQWMEETRFLSRSLVRSAVRLFLDYSFTPIRLLFLGWQAVNENERERERE
jgi:hypothetical protein